VRPYLEKSQHKKGYDGVAQGIGSEFKPQYCQKKKKSRGRAVGWRFGDSVDWESFHVLNSKFLP
jgi:hypothetical protein